MSASAIKRLGFAAREYYNGRFRQFASRAVFLQWQQRELNAHLQWVCEHSPYYRDCIGLPLSDYPLMNKAGMMDHFNQINTLGLDRDNLFDIALATENNREFCHSQLDGNTVGMSSGTSGRRGLFLVSKEEQARWAGYIVGRLMPSLIGPQRIALLLRANSNLYQSVGRAHISFQYTDLCQPVDSWLAKLELYNPTIIVGSAQALLVAARESKKLRPRLVVSGAEVLAPEEKQELGQRFGCDIKEVYQCTEGFLACTHRDGKMRWNEDLVYIEKRWINTEKTHFQPIVTDFRRKSQPVIRYLMDDIILPSEENGVFSGIDKIVGRSGDVLNIGDVMVLPDLISNAISREITSRIDYRITQVSNHRLKIHSNHSAEGIEKALRRLFATLGVSSDHTFFFEHAGSPPQDLSAKHRRVVNQSVSADTQAVSSAA